MKQSIQVLNIKCSGCANTITEQLQSIGAVGIVIDIPSGNIEFEYTGEFSLIRERLLSLGYPEVGSKEAKSLMKKAKSYISCAIGKIA